MLFFFVNDFFWFEIFNVVFIVIDLLVFYVVYLIKGYLGDVYFF